MTDQTVDLTAGRAGPAPEAGDPRVDWRFLLPHADLGRVAVDRATGTAVRSALAGAAHEVVELGAADGPFDAIVLTDPRPADLGAAVEALAPTGALRIEGASARRRRALGARLHAMGFTSSRWWARPSSADAWCLVCLDQPRGAATVLQTVAGRGRRAVVEARAARLGLAARSRRDVDLLARRVSPGPSPVAVAGTDPTTPIAALVTPRYAASRAVVGVTVDPSGRRLHRIAKVARSVADDPDVEAEAVALAAFAERSPAGAPTGHRLERRGGRSVLLEDAVVGTPLDRRVVRDDPTAALDQGLAWLRTVPVEPPSRPRDDGRSRALLWGPLRTVAELRTASPPAHRDRVRRTADLLEPLIDVELPVVFEHGDLSHPNLFSTPSGLVAIDWERAVPQGLPLHDLTFFVAYLAESIDRPQTRVALVDSYRRAVQTGGWARRDIELGAERLGVDLRLVPLLQLACWTRTLARLGEPG
ncbi:MAG TPA: hypothetical protein VHK88_03100, partial [Aquihabitans sp.]|nr:hypothetical protein [Aquihabitans sp.]